MWIWILAGALVLLFLMMLSLARDVDGLRRDVSSLRDSVQPVLDAQKKERYRQSLVDAIHEGGPGSDVAAGMLRDLDKD
jgi:hypothetical protein